MTIDFGFPPATVLAVFAKQPIAGQTKTRLAQETSSAWAIAAAEAMLEDSLDLFADIELDCLDREHPNPSRKNAARQIVYAPANATDYFGILARNRFALTPQSDGDLGDRLGSFFDWAQERFKKTIVVGTDSPTLPADYVTGAIRALDTSDVVIGPAIDGGFYLLGMASKRVRPFKCISWSTPQVLEQMLPQFGRQARIAMLSRWYDIDTVEDWARMRTHIRAMRLRGLDPRVPRVERLMNDEWNVNRPSRRAIVSSER